MLVEIRQAVGRQRHGATRCQADVPDCQADVLQPVPTQLGHLAGVGSAC